MQIKGKARINHENCLFLECDIQEKMRELIPGYPVVIHNGRRMTQASKVLGIPVISTQQNPKTFGSTVKEISDHHHEKVMVFEKGLFSMVTEEVAEKIKGAGKEFVVLYGVESHVCVKQTVLDIMSQWDVQVILIVDATASISPVDRRVAIESMRDMGV